MPATEPPRTPEDSLAWRSTSSIGGRPALRPEDDGKFVAIDVGTGDYEIDQDDYTPSPRLRARRRPEVCSNGPDSRPPTK